MQPWHDSHDANLIRNFLCLVVQIDDLFGKLVNGQTPFEKAAIELLIVYDISNSSSRLAASESLSVLVVDSCIIPCAQQHLFPFSSCSTIRVLLRGDPTILDSRDYPGEGIRTKFPQFVRTMCRYVLVVCMSGYVDEIR